MIWSVCDRSIRRDWRDKTRTSSPFKRFQPIPGAAQQNKMSKRPTHREIPEEHRAAQHLDNERTFLAWVRTNVALISLGFVLARLSPTLSAAGAVYAGRIAAETCPLGIVLVVFGGFVTLAACWPYAKGN